MATEIDTAINFLNVLSEASQLANILGYATQLTSTLPFFGAALGLLKALFPLPDEKHEEILRCFEKLNNKIDHVRDDIKNLETMIKWEVAQLKYGEVVNRIKLGMEYCADIRKAVGKDKKAHTQALALLKDTCANQNITLALNALFDGMTGNGLFTKNILDEFYLTTRGNRPKVTALASRLLQLVCGGLIVLATYETVVRDMDGARAMTKKYEGRLKDVSFTVQRAIERCVECFEANMIADLEAFLGSGQSNGGIATEIKDSMLAKYDWLETFCVVYNDLQGFDQHCFNGCRVDSLHHKGKCGIVFYRPRGEPPRFSNRYNEAYQIVAEACRMLDSAWSINAEEGYKYIVASLEARRIGWTGCAVITRNPDLFFGGTISTLTAYVIGKNVTAILILQ